LKSYYQLLDLEPTCSTAEIKKAFRRKAKTFHPDIRPSGKKGAMMLRLITAYRILSDPALREEYDRTHRSLIYDDSFDYRAFLSKRTDDPVSMAKLIFFDLLHGNEAEAVALYDRLATEQDFDLSLYVERVDFMDCAFLLAEEYERAAEYGKSFVILRRIVDYELEKPYFRHFFREVIDRLHYLSCVALSGKVENSELLRYLKDLAALDLSAKDTAAFLKKIAEIYDEEKAYDLAREYLNSGLKLHAKLPGAKKLAALLA